MNKYLTPKNIAMVIMAICIIILLMVVFKKQPEPINSEAIATLKEQILYLENQNAALKNRMDMQKRLDSTLIKKYEQRIWSDHITIEQLKKKRDEKITAIDTAGNSELRELLSKD